MSDFLSDASDDLNPRKKSRARERVERRRQTRSTPAAVTTPMTPVRRPRAQQVIPAGIQSFNWQDLPLNTIRLVLLFVGAAA